MKNTLRTALRSIALLHLAALFPLTPAFAQSGKSRDCIAEKGPLPAEVRGVGTAIDGDTIAITGAAAHVRLWGIQAPELRNKATQEETLPGMRSRAHLAGILALGDVTCRPVKYERYCRYLAFCDAALPWGDTPGTTADLSESMLDQGFAYGAWLDDPAPGQPALGRNMAVLENEARKAKRGLWKDWDLRE